jgi:hypothetical protein
VRAPGYRPEVAQPSDDAPGPPYDPALREAYLSRIVDAAGRQAAPVQPTDATAVRGSGSAPA